MTTMSKDAARSCIYFRALRSADYAYDWYKIDDTTDSGTHLSPALPRLPISSELSSCVSLGPTIYVFGGAKVSADGSYVKGHLDELHWIDTLHPDESGWVKAPPTTRPRALTYQANINGKIYLMGRGVTDVLENPELNCWRSLKPPLVKTSPSGHAVLDGGKGFLVNYPLLDVLYKFDVVRNTWSVHDLDCGRIGFKTASVDCILFCFLSVPSSRGICGYLVSDSKPFGSPKPVLGLEVLDLISAEKDDYVMDYVPKALLNAGDGKLCAIYTRDLGVGSGNIKVYCLKFRVSKDFDEVSGETNLVAENPVLSHYYCDDVVNIFDTISVSLERTLNQWRSNTPIVKFLDKNNSPFTVNIYPFLSLYYGNGQFPIDFAFFDGISAPIVDNNGVEYSNVFDANLDTLISALKAEGCGNLTIIVREIGWPMDSEQNANVLLAQKFYNGFVRRLAKNIGTPPRPVRRLPKNIGTPLRPGYIEVYFFGLLNKNAKSTLPGDFEPHWGIFRYDGQPKFPLDISGQGQNKSLVAAKNEAYQPNQWCACQRTQCQFDQA